MLPLLVLALSAWTPVPHGGMGRAIAPARISSPARVVHMMIEDKPAPPEVIEAEANATPNRKYRVGIAAAGFFIAAASAALSASVMAGQPDALKYRDLVLFDNPPLSLIVDVVIAGSTAWAIAQEEKTKKENIQRIWEEVQRRRSGVSPTAAGGNRSQRRAKKVAVPASPGPFAGGFDPAASARAPPPPKPKPKPPPPPSAAPSAPNGVLGAARDFFDEANALGKAQAIALNTQLEDAGVLPSTTPTGADNVGAPDATLEPDAGAKATAIAQDASVSANTGTSNNRKPKGKKNKKAGASKRKKQRK